MTEQTKVCIDCGETKPESQFESQGTGRRRSRCGPCHRQYRRTRKTRQKKNNLQELEKVAIRRFLGEASAGGENIPHSAELLERCMEYFGGSSGFAALVVKQYFDSPAGSSTRTKLLETLVRLTLKNTEMGGAKKPMEQWTDEELEDELNSRLRRFAEQFQGKIVDATPETPSDFATAFGGAAGLLPEVPVEGAAGGVREPADRSLEDVPADSDSGGDARLQGE